VPDLIYLHALPDAVVKNPNASTLLLTHAQRWKALHDLHALNIVDFGRTTPGSSTPSNASRDDCCRTS